MSRASAGCRASSPVIPVYDIEALAADARTSPDRAAGRATLAKARPALVAAFVCGFAAVCGLVLVLPGATVTTKYLNDLFGLLDGAFRVASGQIPNRDFHTVLGPLVHYLPAAGLRLSGSLGSAVPLGVALFLLLLAPPMAHVLGSRLRGAIALPFAAFLLLIVAVPITLGETVTSLSFGRFYNRVGWAALATLLVMYLRPASPTPRQDFWDALAAAVLILVMLYTKATYAVAAAAFVVFLLFDAGQRRWVALALAASLAGALAVEAVWGSSRAYLADLLLAAEVSGGLRGTAGQILDHLLRNLADFVLFGLFAALALWRSRRFRDLLFYGFCAVAGFLIINQNFQTWGIVSLYAGAAVAAETLARSEDRAGDGRWPVGLGAPLFLLALVLPTIVHCTIALAMHAGIAAARGGERVGLPNFAGVRLVHLWTWGEHESATKYLAGLEDGARALAELDAKPGPVFVLDAVNRFSAALGLAPARGDSPWLLWGRTLDEQNFVPPEELLRDVRIVMEPKLANPEMPPEQPNSARGIAGLRQVYGAYIAANFDLVRETEHWRVHLRQPP
jgi:hypothetical protein